MSLCRFLPAPSDRMAILWGLLCMEDAVVLEYGPAGTTHFSMILYGSLGITQHGRMYTTHMSEDDVVMGDVTRLEKAIIEADRNSSAKVIFVVASSISSIIGTDIKGVCLEMQEKVKAKLICFDQGGLKGDYSVGIHETYKLLCKELTEKQNQIKEKTYNILGISMGQYRANSDFWELTQLMQEAFDYKVHASLCTETSVAPIISAGSAELNLVIRDEALAAAKILEKKCKTPYILGSPYGYQGTLEWLQSISKQINVEINPAMRERLEKKAKDLKQNGMRRIVRDIVPTATIMGDYDRVTGIAKLMHEMNISINAQVCDHSLFLIEDKDANVQYLTKEKDKIDILTACHDQIIFADDISLHIAHNSNTKVLVSAPIKQGPIANHMPIIGEKGTDFLREKISLYFRSITKKMI